MTSSCTPSGREHSYLPHTATDREDMLGAIGVESIEDLFAAVPATLRECELALPPGLTESEVCDRIEMLAARNVAWGARSFAGAGLYNHFVPAAVRALAGRAEFATAYTPYQAEVSQGTLQHIFEFQTAICGLTGLDVANASLWDGPSAAAEAAFLGLRHTKREAFAYSAGLHPETIEVLHTYAGGPGFATRSIGLIPSAGRTAVPAAVDLEGAGAFLVQQPNFLGVIEDLAPLAEAAHAAGVLFVVCQNPMTLGLLADPGSQGADIAVGDTQVFGNAMNFGGPTIGYMACRRELLRQLPGRLVGQTVDLDGRTCYTLTLQAREQHIRRAKATSNICSNQALCALASTIYLALLGPVGLRRLGEICVQRAHWLAQELTALPGVSLAFAGPFFYEFTLHLPVDAEDFRRDMMSRGIDPGVPATRVLRAAKTGGADAGAAISGPDADKPRYALLVAVTEINTPAALREYVAAAREALA